VVGLALPALLGCLALREKCQRRISAARDLSPVEQRMADGLSAPTPGPDAVPGTP